MNRTILCLLLASFGEVSVLSFTPLQFTTVTRKGEVHTTKSSLKGVKRDDNNDEDNSSSSFSSRRDMMQKVIGATAVGSLVIGGNVDLAHALVSFSRMTFVGGREMKHKPTNKLTTIVCSKLFTLQ